MSIYTRLDIGFFSAHLQHALQNNEAIPTENSSDNVILLEIPSTHEKTLAEAQNVVLLEDSSVVTGRQKTSRQEVTSTANQENIPLNSQVIPNKQMRTIEPNNDEKVPSAFKDLLFYVESDPIKRKQRSVKEAKIKEKLPAVISSDRYIDYQEKKIKEKELQIAKRAALKAERERKKLMQEAAKKIKQEAREEKLKQNRIEKQRKEEEKLRKKREREIETQNSKNKRPKKATNTSNSSNKKAKRPRVSENDKQ